ncbi:Histidine kinase-, DNA gyrase B-, and HSP90-like ATPase [Streptomyces sp. WMMB 714]|uniref:HD domain-containing protein n=1 Tax=Streptomyces sp. WMMB 714 TaxID=1286822 RepID=UPI000823D3DD|nr:ATP-binding protein [Streptomyces sp. WMMB 714]SCK24734.1 Histidine kinase-, DNA gyrase B-, and HSP90-like ATPase [Streptomyces sp. WMMB 714]
MSYQETHFWKIFEECTGQKSSSEAKRLLAEFERSRERAALIAAEINRDSANLTQHDISHIDALWEYAELVCGSDYALNPAEIYVLGISFLVHDLANGIAAIPGGMEEISQDSRWQDVLVAEYRSEHGHYPSHETQVNMDHDIEAKAVARYLRETHADYAARIPLASYEDSATGASFHLIEDAELRNQYGHLAGRIAASHWWSSKELRREFGVKIGARASMPTDWQVDPLVLACILRCADASHLDSRRAPAFLRALRKPCAESMPHWIFQDKLQKPRIHEDRLSYTSLSPFSRDESDAWWVCHDALATLHDELTAVDNILSDAGRHRFAVRAVVGVSDLEELARSIKTEGWHPIDARVKATDVIALVHRLGGAELYGNDLSVPIRELISNAADAVRAKKALLSISGVAPWEIAGDITVTLREDVRGAWLHIRDTGVGMSKSVLTNALLNFGTSYWDSAQSRRDLPGLLSSGFRPTGQYGIGFFSVFMIGHSVQVISRRYDAAASETLVLEFANGVSRRPMLRTADSHEQLVSGGTEVKVLLSQPVANILSIRRSNRPTKDLVSLEEFCAWLCPALDVDLHVADKAVGRRLVVAADDWKHIDRDDLIDRLYIDRDPVLTEKMKEAIEGDLEPVISPDGDIVARMAIAPSILDPDDLRDEDSDDPVGRSLRSFSAPLVVGGVRAQTHMQHSAGLIVAKTVRAARDIAIPIVQAEDFSSWASRQAQKEILDKRITHDLVGLYADTGNLTVAETAAGEVTFDELTGYCSTRSRIVLVQDAAWSNYCRGSSGTPVLGDDIVLLHVGGSVPLNASRRYHEFDNAVFNWGRDWQYESFLIPNSMTGVALRAVAAAWDLEESAMYSYFNSLEERGVEEVGVDQGGNKSIRLRTFAVLSRSDL